MLQISIISLPAYLNYYSYLVISVSNLIFEYFLYVFVLLSIISFIFALCYELKNIEYGKNYRNHSFTTKI